MKHDKQKLLLERRIGHQHRTVVLFSYDMNAFVRLYHPSGLEAIK